MIPAGYMAKRIATRPDWLQADRVADVYLVSHCVSNVFTDHINHRKHSGYWLFDSPETMRELANARSLDLTRTKLFYYEVHEREYDEQEKSWKSFGPEPSFKTAIMQPTQRHLEGYDVVTFSVHTNPECSPLSCNALASEVETNEHSLLSSFEEAKQLLEEGKLDHSEPGPYRIFAVYSVQCP